MRLDATVDRVLNTARGVNKAAIITAKLLVTGACFWYLSRRVDLAQIFSSISLLEPAWIVVATFIVMLQVPLVAMRWREILRVLGALDRRMTNISIIAITSIGVFFAQVLPSLMGDGIRAWLLIRRGCDWRSAVTSVVIDRGVGATVLIALGFVILLLPSGLSALGGYRDLVLIVYGTLLLAGVGVLLFLPTLIALLERLPYLGWATTLAMSARRILLGPRSCTILGLSCVIHAFTIIVIWLLGRAQGLLLPLSDAAVLFVVAIGVALVPISINGWGLRELAVVAVLSRHGVVPEKALVFSVCFGVIMLVGSLPGALAWVLYSLTPAKWVEHSP